MIFNYLLYVFSLLSYDIKVSDMGKEFCSHVRCEERFLPKATFPLNDEIVKNRFIDITHKKRVCQYNSLSTSPTYCQSYLKRALKHQVSHQWSNPSNMRLVRTYALIFSLTSIGRRFTKAWVDTVVFVCNKPWKHLRNFKVGRSLSFDGRDKYLCFPDGNAPPRNT